MSTISSPVKSIRAKYIPIMEELNNIVELCLEDLADQLDQRKDFIISFLEKADYLPKKAVTDVINTLLDKLPYMVDLMMQHPKEFWRFFKIFSAVFSHEESSNIYKGKIYF